MTKTTRKTAAATKAAPEPVAATAPEGTPGPLIDPADVTNMTRSDINDVTAGGLDDDGGPKRDMAEGLAQESDEVKTDEPEMHPFRAGPGSDIA